MAGYSWSEIEDAVVAALRPVLAERVKTLRAYQGDWREDLRQESWRLPAVLVRLGGARAVAVGPCAYEVSLELTVLVLTRDLRPAEGRRGEEGTYALGALVREALWHQDLGRELVPLALVEERPLSGPPEYEVQSLTFRTGWLETPGAG
jgi:phage gp37-like protein